VFGSIAYAQKRHKLEKKSLMEKEKNTFSLATVMKQKLTDYMILMLTNWWFPEMLFLMKQATWSWQENQVSAPNIIEEEKRGPTPNQDPPSSRSPEPSASDSDSPPRKVCSLQNIYDSCDSIFLM